MPEKEKPLVLLTGASGSMGFETFRLLWEKRDKYDMVLLLRPSKKNRKLFRRYINDSKSEDPGSSLRIVWGDALNRSDIEEACRGIDYCLHPMALISPAADRDPEMAWKVNARGTRYIVEAIEAQDPDHIKLVYIGSVAEYGDRLPPVHVGRTGDALIPSVYDHYALTKIDAEQAVMQSRIKHKVSLRQTFIMIPDLFSLMDPIMFHQPLNSYMENITAKDSGRLLAACLEVPDGSEFWNNYYNVSGGPGCRITYIEFLDRIFSMLGLRYKKVMERKWFALKNFHMQFFEDAGKPDRYLNHWDGGQGMDDFYRDVWNNLPWYLKIMAGMNRGFLPFKWLTERITFMQLKRLAFREDGTMNWIGQNNQGRIAAFYGSEDAFRSIPDWNSNMPLPDHNQEYVRLDHGYDEKKAVIETEDLVEAARFRGGELLGEEEQGEADWKGGMHDPLYWKCCRGHLFQMTPHAVLKGGHWCVRCISEPWDRKPMYEKNAFARQVLV
ncbi:MAG: NAD(P)-dependent oxidoreductase [Bacteroidales bacterium]|nr:NAD(P)-dependent oxidoreductase [Bacteroidales bacterium]